jgi:hypothetical protein
MSADATYDVTTPIGRVRLLISDTDVERPIFGDAELAAFLGMNGGLPLMAAAEGLDALATNEALVLKVIRTQDLTTDGATLSKELRARAADLRARAAAGQFTDTTDGGFTVVVGQTRASELTEWEAEALAAARSEAYDGWWG